MKTLALAKDLKLPADEAAILARRILDGSVENENGCLIWQQSTKNGYGQMSVDGRSTYTHRLSYKLFVGPIPSGLDVCHKCDVRRCNHPDHFFLGTRKVNLEDMRQKGRGSAPPRHLGASHPQARLTDDQVAEIRRLAAGGIQQRDLAKQFGCSQGTVSSLVRRQYRKDAP